MGWSTLLLVILALAGALYLYWKRLLGAAFGLLAKYKGIAVSVQEIYCFGFDGLVLKLKKGPIEELHVGSCALLTELGFLPSLFLGSVHVPVLVRDVRVLLRKRGVPEIDGVDGGELGDAEPEGEGGVNGAGGDGGGAGASAGGDAPSRPPGSPLPPGSPRPPAARPPTQGSGRGKPPVRQVLLNLIPHLPIQLLNVTVEAEVLEGVRATVRLEEAKATLGDVHEALIQGLGVELVVEAGRLARGAGREAPRAATAASDPATPRSPPAPLSPPYAGSTVGPYVAGGFAPRGLARAGDFGPATLGLGGAGDAARPLATAAGSHGFPPGRGRHERGEAARAVPSSSFGMWGALGGEPPPPRRRASVSPLSSGPAAGPDDRAAPARKASRHVLFELESLAVTHQPPPGRSPASFVKYEGWLHLGDVAVALGAVSFAVPGDALDALEAPLRGTWARRRARPGARSRAPGSPASPRPRWAAGGPPVPSSVAVRLGPVSLRAPGWRGLACRADLAGAEAGAAWTSGSAPTAFLRVGAASASAGRPDADAITVRAGALDSSARATLALERPPAPGGRRRGPGGHGSSGGAAPAATPSSPAAVLAAGLRVGGGQAAAHLDDVATHVDSAAAASAAAAFATLLAGLGREGVAGRGGQPRDPAKPGAGRLPPSPRTAPPTPSDEGETAGAPLAPALRRTDAELPAASAPPWHLEWSVARGLHVSARGPGGESSVELSVAGVRGEWSSGAARARLDLLALRSRSRGETPREALVVQLIEVDAAPEVARAETAPLRARTSGGAADTTGAEGPGPPSLPRSSAASASSLLAGGASASSLAWLAAPGGASSSQDHLPGMREGAAGAGAAGASEAPVPATASATVSVPDVEVSLDDGVLRALEGVGAPLALAVAEAAGAVRAALGGAPRRRPRPPRAAAARLPRPVVLSVASVLLVAESTVAVRRPVPDGAPDQPGQPGPEPIEVPVALALLVKGARATRGAGASRGLAVALVRALFAQGPDAGGSLRAAARLDGGDELERRARERDGRAPAGTRGPASPLGSPRSVPRAGEAHGDEVGGGGIWGAAGAGGGVWGKSPPAPGARPGTNPSPEPAPGILGTASSARSSAALRSAARPYPLSPAEFPPDLVPPGPPDLTALSILDAADLALSDGPHASAGPRELSASATSLRATADADAILGALAVAAALAQSAAAIALAGSLGRETADPPAPTGRGGGEDEPSERIAAPAGHPPPPPAPPLAVKVGSLLVDFPMSEGQGLTLSLADLAAAADERGGRLALSLGLLAVDSLGRPLFRFERVDIHGRRALAPGTRLVPVALSADGAAADGAFYLRRGLPGWAAEADAAGERESLVGIGRGSETPVPGAIGAGDLAPDLDGFPPAAHDPAGASPVPTRTPDAPPLGAAGPSDSPRSPHPTPSGTLLRAAPPPDPDATRVSCAFARPSAAEGEALGDGPASLWAVRLGRAHVRVPYDRAPGQAIKFATLHVDAVSELARPDVARIRAAADAFSRPVRPRVDAALGSELGVGLPAPPLSPPAPERSRVPGLFPLATDLAVDSLELAFEHHPLERWLGACAPALRHAASLRHAWEEALVELAPPAVVAARVAGGLGKGSSPSTAGTAAAATPVAADEHAAGAPSPTTLHHARPAERADPNAHPDLGGTRPFTVDLGSSRPRLSPRGAATVARGDTQRVSSPAPTPRDASGASPPQRGPPSTFRSFHQIPRPGGASLSPFDVREAAAEAAAEAERAAWERAMEGVSRSYVAEARRVRAAGGSEHAATIVARAVAARAIVGGGDARRLAEARETAARLDAGAGERTRSIAFKSGRVTRPEVNVGHFAITLGGADRPLVETSDAYGSGVLVALKQASLPPAKEPRAVAVGRLGRGARPLASLRGTSPAVKFYTDARLDVGRVSVGWGPGLEAAIAAMSMAGKRLAPLDPRRAGAPRPPFPWWDELRYQWRGRARLRAARVDVALGAGQAPSLSGAAPRLELLARGATLDLSTNALALDAAALVARAVDRADPRDDPTGAAREIPLLDAGRVRIDLAVRWAVAGDRDPLDHYIFPNLGPSHGAPAQPSPAVQSPLVPALLNRSVGLDLDLQVSFGAAAAARARSDAAARREAAARHRGAAGGPAGEPSPAPSREESSGLSPDGSPADEPVEPGTPRQAATLSPAAPGSPARAEVVERALSVGTLSTVGSEASWCGDRGSDTASEWSGSARDADPDDGLDDAEGLAAGSGPGDAALSEAVLARGGFPPPPTASEAELGGSARPGGVGGDAADATPAARSLPHGLYGAAPRHGPTFPAAAGAGASKASPSPASAEASSLDLASGAPHLAVGEPQISFLKAWIGALRNTSPAVRAALRRGTFFTRKPRGVPPKKNLPKLLRRLSVHALAAPLHVHHCVAEGDEPSGRGVLTSHETQFSARFLMNQPLPPGERARVPHVPGLPLPTRVIPGDLSVLASAVSFRIDDGADGAPPATPHRRDSLGGAGGAHRRRGTSEASPPGGEGRRGSASYDTTPPRTPRPSLFETLSRAGVPQTSRPSAEPPLAAAATVTVVREGAAGWWDRAAGGADGAGEGGSDSPGERPVPARPMRISVEDLRLAIDLAARDALWSAVARLLAAFGTGPGDVATALRRAITRAEAGRTPVQGGGDRALAPGAGSDQAGRVGGGAGAGAGSDISDGGPALLSRRGSSAPHWEGGAALARRSTLTGYPSGSLGAGSKGAPKGAGSDLLRLLLEQAAKDKAERRRKRAAPRSGASAAVSGDAPAERPASSELSESETEREEGDKEGDEGASDYDSERSDDVMSVPDGAGTDAGDGSSLGGTGGAGTGADRSGPHESLVWEVVADGLQLSIGAGDGSKGRLLVAAGTMRLRGSRIPALALAVTALDLDNVSAHVAKLSADPDAPVRWLPREEDPAPTADRPRPSAEDPEALVRRILNPGSFSLRHTRRGVYASTAAGGSGSGSGGRWGAGSAPGQGQSQGGGDGSSNGGAEGGGSASGRRSLAQTPSSQGGGGASRISRRPSRPRPRVARAAGSRVGGADTAAAASRGEEMIIHVPGVVAAMDPREFSVLVDTVSLLLTAAPRVSTAKSEIELTLGPPGAEDPAAAAARAAYLEALLELADRRNAAEAARRLVGTRTVRVRLGGGAGGSRLEGVGEGDASGHHARSNSSEDLAEAMDSLWQGAGGGGRIKGTRGSSGNASGSGGKGGGHLGAGQTAGAGATALATPRHHLAAYQAPGGAASTGTGARQHRGAAHARLGHAHGASADDAPARGHPPDAGARSRRAHLSPEDAARAARRRWYASPSHPYPLRQPQWDPQSSEAGDRRPRVTLRVQLTPEALATSAAPAAPILAGPRQDAAATAAFYGPGAGDASRAVARAGTLLRWCEARELAAADAARGARARAAAAARVAPTRARARARAARTLVSVDRVVWQMVDAQREPLAQATLRGLSFDRLRDRDASASSRFILHRLSLLDARGLLDAAPGLDPGVILAAWNPDSSWDRDALVRVTASVGAPGSAGSAPGVLHLEHVDAAVHPLAVHLTEELAVGFWDYFFPKEDDAARRRSEFSSTLPAQRRAAGKDGGSAYASGAAASGTPPPAGSATVPSGDEDRPPRSARRVRASLDASEGSRHRVSSSLGADERGPGGGATRARTLSDATHSAAGARAPGGGGRAAGAPGTPGGAAGPPHSGAAAAASSATTPLSSHPLPSGPPPAPPTRASRALLARNVASGAAAEEDPAPARVGRRSRKDGGPPKIRFKHVRTARFHCRVTYRGYPKNMTDLKVVLDGHVYEGIEGRWRDLFQRMKWDTIKSVLKSVAGLQRGKFREILPGGRKGATSDRGDSKEHKHGFLQSALASLTPRRDKPDGGDGDGPALGPSAPAADPKDDRKRRLLVGAAAPTPAARAGAVPAPAPARAPAAAPGPPLPVRRAQTDAPPGYAPGPLRRELSSSSSLSAPPSGAAARAGSPAPSSGATPPRDSANAAALLGATGAKAKKDTKWGRRLAKLRERLE